MKLSEIQLQVMWSRLLAIVEEQAQTLVRTAFSTSAREAGDISAGLFDLDGRMIAQAETGTPGHVNSMAAAVPHFIAEFPIASMKEGDSFITNDPWKATGHLSDFTVVTPSFHAGKLVGIFACTTHVVDIGGQGQSPDGRQIYNEGLWIPIMHLLQEGTVVEPLMQIIKQNVREPIQVEGDLYALVACNEVGSKRLGEMLSEYHINDLKMLSNYIVDSTRAAMLRAIADFPKGRGQAHMRIDGYESPVDLRASVEINDEEIIVDYDGTSGVSDFGINCPKSYTDAYTAFGIKCIVAPFVPNNHGSLQVVTTRAPIGSIVNAQPPCAVMARSIIGHMLPDVVFGCLHEISPDRVPAEGTSGLWSVKLTAGHGVTPRPDDQNSKWTSFTVTSFHSGGTGARPTEDGLSATPFPSGVRSVPIEVTEAITPLVFWKKEFRSGSGGKGQYRGGLGQTMVIGNTEDAAFALLATFDRTIYPARGRNGGGAGALGAVTLASGKILSSKGRQIVPAGDRLVLDMPGGGGYGDHSKRRLEATQRDLLEGFELEQ